MPLSKSWGRKEGKDPDWTKPERKEGLEQEGNVEKNTLGIPL